jgi:hypothetical protein
MTVQNKPKSDPSSKNFFNNASHALNAYKKYEHSEKNVLNNIGKAAQVYLNPVLPENPSTQQFVSPAPAPQTPSIAPPKLTPTAFQSLPVQAKIDIMNLIQKQIQKQENIFKLTKDKFGPIPSSREVVQLKQEINDNLGKLTKVTELHTDEITQLMMEINEKLDKLDKLAQNRPSQEPKNPTLAPKTPSAVPPKPAIPQKTTLPSQGSNTQPQNPFTLQNSKLKPTPEQAAITLQRRFRYRRPALKQAVKNQQPLSDQAALELNLQKRGLPLPSSQSVIPRPAPGTYAVDPKKAKDWVNAHPPEARKLAKQFLSCITYRSQKKFERQLQLTIQDFNRHLASMPVDKRDYVLVTDILDSLYKSDGWVQLLALKYLMTKHLVQIISHNLLEQTSQLPGHNILICDDGAYSGLQMSLTVATAQKTGKKIFLAIPFMTRRSKVAINLFKSKQIHICKHQIIFTLKELGFPFDSKRSAFIFNHKVPDLVSIPDAIIRRGNLLNNIIPNEANNAQLLAKFPTSSVNVPFINNPNEQPPYKVKSNL